jgi:hypothetical protein
MALPPFCFSLSLRTHTHTQGLMPLSTKGPLSLTFFYQILRATLISWLILGVPLEECVKGHMGTAPQVRLLWGNSSFYHASTC